MKLRQILVVIITSFFFVGAANKQSNEVVIYTSLDQIFSEPILKQFEQSTGIKVKAVYDIEAAKTTGLVNRLIAEKNNPQADVFWNSEVGRTLILKKKDVLQSYHSPSAGNIPPQFKDPQGYWCGFAVRARIIIINTNLVKPENEPRSIFDLLKEEWKGKITIGNPLFGTTSTHAAALFVKLGEEKAAQYFNDLMKNKVAVVDGNSVVRDMVAAGELAAGFTDTDDANLVLLEGKPVKIIYPDQDTFGTLVIPNTVAVVKNAPHIKAAKLLIDYLLSEEVEEHLAHSGSMQIPVRININTPDYVPAIGKIKAMEISCEEIASKMESTAKTLQNIFLR
ncbi:MAG: extracellular solute-binding protein [Candidatus Omnitrophota bacterium]